jgi:hypothetical protein
VINPETGIPYEETEFPLILPDSLDLFGDDTPLKIQLTSDFKAFVKNKYDDEYQPAELNFFVNDSVSIRHDIRIKPRGNFRKRHCQFPPIRLNFKKTDFVLPRAHQFEKIKMVTDCKRTDIYEQYVLKEYLIYKIYNYFSPLSFQVRLLDVTYVNTGKDNDENTTFAFVIEELDDLAARTECLAIDKEDYNQSQLKSKHMLTVALFQYMISNVDWSVPGQHNLKILKSTDIHQPIPYVIPYDFDYSGFVNTYYAVPKEQLGLKSVQDRYFEGLCYEEATIQEALQQFMENKQNIYALLNEFPYLDKNSRKDLLNFIDEFYEQIEAKNSWRYFAKNCRS